MRAWQKSLGLISAGVATLVVAGCTIGGADKTTGNAVAGQTTTKSASEAVVTVTPANDDQPVNPLDQVRVDVAKGTLTSVTLTNPDGKVVPGITTPDRTSWKPDEPLGYGKTYHLTVNAIDGKGLTTAKSTTFATLEPSNQTKVYLNTTGGAALADGGTYGVGTVVVAHFDEAIDDKAAAEKTLTVKTDPPVQGSWYWLDNQNAHWRPQNYYQPGTKVTVDAKLYGKKVGDGLYGQEDEHVAFQIGDSHVSIADDDTKMVTVYENGQVARTMPTSMGMGGEEVVGGKTIHFWTQPGTYTVMDKANPVIMDSSTFGLPINSRLGYKESINWATRISTDGIYLHELESTVWAQGNTDTSHGCLNLNPTNAKWFYNFSQPGDVVEVKNTGGPALEVWQNGDWSVPWSEWAAGSALHA
ncbi:L,D-transpeptidase family protein [Rhodococcus sp. D2-41]|uniref:Ig-like domain-containing protein n=1 Tax=Speluncibacter jeojiensis TaxID=2710754 RepID=A0A9X4RCZ3_9ACTN|nr:Ig-like domain-containing protein [Rhodococcus sp. D2-41]MDG3010371.1 L,D-transpeptidase family protein [Rhodococcus sp. D2-41]MDG3014108.1 Ig-like domain-containing protein [Corynebacteriales bacterium D3-21]